MAELTAALLFKAFQGNNLEFQALAMAFMRGACLHAQAGLIPALVSDRRVRKTQRGVDPHLKEQWVNQVLQAGSKS